MASKPPGRDEEESSGVNRFIQSSYRLCRCARCRPAPRLKYWRQPEQNTDQNVKANEPLQGGVGARMCGASGRGTGSSRLRLGWFSAAGVAAVGAVSLLNLEGTKTQSCSSKRPISQDSHHVRRLAFFLPNGGSFQTFSRATRPRWAQANAVSLPTWREQNKDEGQGLEPQLRGWGASVWREVIRTA